MKDNTEIVVYQTPDKFNILEVIVDNDTVWLTQSQLADLFISSRVNITEHINNLYKEGELSKGSTCRKFRQVRKEGKRQVEKDVDFYNLDMIISIGYRVNSDRVLQFRQWTTIVLDEFCQTRICI